MMKAALARQPFSKAAASRRPASRAIGAQPSLISRQLFSSPRLSRCACGGSCPRCQEKFRQPEGVRITEPNDAFEREADDVAAKIMRMPGRPSIHSARSGVQRKCTKCKEEEEKKLIQTQREASAESTAALDAGAAVLATERSGVVLPGDVRSYFEPRLGYDFSRVRIHADANAADGARAVRARAYTFGSNIVFAQGEYSPATVEGRRLLAHELVHVVQQNGGCAAPTASGGDAALRTSANNGEETRSAAVADSHARTSGDRGGTDVGATDGGKVSRSRIARACASRSILMRTEGEKSGFPAVASPLGPAPPAIGAEFDVRPNDPPCAQAPKGLGKIAPEVDCPVTTEDIGFLGHHFHFCLGSDVFAVPQTPTEVLRFVRKQPAQSRFKVHGFASIEGNPDDNMRLSCHRALRVAREMINAGVPPESIEIARRGATEEFPGGPEFNRVVVVQVIPPSDVTPSGPNLPTGTREEKGAIVERARQILREGNYNLGADAYLSFWTCGKVKRVSDAVDRMHVRFEGEPNLNVPGPEGTAENIGVNVIALSNVVLGAGNQIDCVIERLVDMSFHQMTLDTIDTFSLRHQGARFLLGLAGLSPCEIPGFSDPIPADDPLAFHAAPPCAETPLPTRLVPSAKDKRHVPPTFDVDPTFESSSARIQWQTDPRTNRALIIVPAFPIVARASVTQKGDPTEFAHYEVGFMQTITRDETVIDYVSGHRLELRVPIPIRDRDRRPSNAPWFASELNGKPDATGTASTLMFKDIVTEVPLAYEDVEKGGKLQPGNVVDTTTRHIHFLTWLVARRRDAPPDRFATHFLNGTEFEFTQQVDVIGIDGRGTFDTSMADADVSSTASMRFGGPTPEDLGPHELNIVTNPPSRGAAAKVTKLEFMGMLREIIEALNPPRLNLKHSPLQIRVFIDAETGRVALPDPSRNFSPIVVTSPNVPEKPRDELAREILVRVRKRDFLGRPDKPAIVKRDPRDQTTSALDAVTIDLAPDPEILLINRPGIKAAMHKLWQNTEIDEAKKDPRGWVLTVYIDRNNNLRPLKLVRGGKPFFRQLPDVGLVRIFPEECGGTATDEKNDTPLGSIHTHPRVASPLPSFKDRETADEGQAACGVQFFLINDDSIMRYDATSDTIISDRKAFIGP
jgi:outer membrane protein OmpA-like peptidoglycan-associated protein